MRSEPIEFFVLGRCEGKKLHDPLALAVAIDEQVVTLVEVKMLHKKDEWGAVLCPGSGVWISVDYNEARFQQVLLRPVDFEGGASSEDANLARA